MNINSASFFQALADDMNRRPDDFYILGDCDMHAVLVMRSDGGDFAIKISFAVLGCSGVAGVSAADADASGDYYLDGPLSAWQAMCDNILPNGKAAGTPGKGVVATQADWTMIPPGVMSGSPLARFLRTTTRNVSGVHGPRSCIVTEAPWIRQSTQSRPTPRKKSWPGESGTDISISPADVPRPSREKVGANGASGASLG